MRRMCTGRSIRRDVSAACFLTLLAFVAVSVGACGGDESKPQVTPHIQRVLSFNPKDARVGDEIVVDGSGWSDPTITIYLQPRDDLIRLGELQDSDQLFPVGRADTHDGRFTFRFTVPDRLSSPSGQRRQDVSPGS